MNSKELMKDESYKFNLGYPVNPSFPIHSDYKQIQIGGSKTLIDYKTSDNLPARLINPAFPIDPKYLKEDNATENKVQEQESNIVDSVNINQFGGNYTLPPLPVNSSFPIDPNYLPKKFKNRLNVNIKKEYNKLPPLPVLPAFPIHSDYLQ